jgi:hypothetical protein
MKVYLAYVGCAFEGHDEEVVGAVFNTERKALDYVIKEMYSGPFYSKMIPAWLDDNARPHVVEMEVK